MAWGPPKRSWKFMSSAWNWVVVIFLKVFFLMMRSPLYSPRLRLAMSQLAWFSTVP